jgi:DNA helicase-2/ATP-dependent DNA helicase PcrA
MNASDEESLRLSTVHQAKGLEWPAVIIIWATEGMFPSGRSLKESNAGEAEERRLFYVAVTRAKDDLLMCVPELRRTRDGGVAYFSPSRFIKELSPELVDETVVGFI